jgi:hypothetical protein
VSGLVPNLVNGVSQQPPKLRLPSQCEASENFYASVVDGLVPRAPSEHLARLRESLPNGSFSQFIFRDDNEMYLFAILPDATVKVWDFDGNEKTVNVLGDAADYLPDTDLPKNVIKALTVADHTFIVNTKKVVAAGTEKSPTRPYEALVHVLAGNYGRDYRIKIDGTLAAGVQTPDGGTASHGAYIDTVHIASMLYKILNTGTASVTDTEWPTGGRGGGGTKTGDADGGYNAAPWAIGRYHSTIYLRNTDADFTLEVEDGYSGRAMKDIKTTVQRFSDLPLYGPEGYVCKIAGDNSNSFNEYYVKFEKLQPNDSTGVWKETLAPDTFLGLDETTMPHLLRREADGTFTFTAGEWHNRKCGDAESNPDPSFVGQTIQDVFFSHNRLGFLTVENYVLSQASDFFNFFRTSVITIVDGDPIDGAASHIKVSLLRHAVPFNDVLLIFSDETQFRLDGNELLTPKTVNTKPLSEIRADKNTRPLVVGSRLYFVSTANDWSTITEYTIDRNTQTAHDEDITAHCPSYIPAGIRHMVASKERGLMVLNTDGDPGKLYVYKNFWNGNERLQSSWSRWTLPGVQSVVAMHFKDGVLYLAVERADGLYIEKLVIRHGSYDPGVPYITYLDRRVSLTGTYDAETNKTSFTAPYELPSGVLCVSKTGTELTPEITGATTFTVDDDWSGAPVWIGIMREAVYEFSTFFRRDDQARVNESAGRLQIMHLILDYGKTNGFHVQVEVDGRPVKAHEFSALMAGDPSTLLDKINTKSGKLTVPIMSRNDRVRIRIATTRWLPCSFSSARWLGTWARSTLER